MEDGRAIGARDLIVAVFRLAVADYLGVWYGHDEPAPVKRTKGASTPRLKNSFAVPGRNIWPTWLASRSRPSGIMRSDCVSATGKWAGQRSGADRPAGRGSSATRARRRGGDFPRQPGYFSLHSPSQLICKSLDFL